MNKTDMKLKLNDLNITYNKSDTKKQLEEKLKNVDIISIDTNDNCDDNVVVDDFKVVTKFKLLGGTHRLNNKTYKKDDIILTNINLTEKFKNKFVEVK